METLIQARIALSSKESNPDDFWELHSIQVFLANELAQIYARELEGNHQRTGKIHTIIGKDEKSNVVIHGHESGPVVFLIPLVSFLGTSIIAGVVGNLAYDKLKDLYQKSVEAVRKAKKSYDENPLDNSTLTEQEIIDRITITITTPEGNFEISFDEEKGLSPVLVKRLVRQIKNYEKKLTNNFSKIVAILDLQ